MFANEIKRFAHEFGIECEIVKTLETCYDNFNGITTAQKPPRTNRLINMHHYYNIVTIDGKKYKIDVAGYLTAQDFNKNYPEAIIDCQDFFFSENLNKKPFENAQLKLASTQFGDNKKTYQLRYVFYFIYDYDCDCSFAEFCELVL